MGVKILLLTLLSATTTLQEIGAEQNQDQRPNILFIIADDLGKGDLACYGNTIVRTPNLDRLAKNGILMNHYRAAAPICGPSRVSILTGRYSERSGYRMALANEKASSLDEPWLAKQLRENGYSTAAFGKWHLGDTNFKDRGFDSWVITSPGGWSDFYKYNILSSEYPPTKSDGTYATDFLTNSAVRFIEKNAALPSRKPFFMYLAYNAPHFPLEAPDEEIAPYRGKGLPAGTEIVYGMVTRLDKGIGRILNILKEKGMLDNTLIVFTSDNGPVLGSYQGLSEKRYNCELAGQKEFMLEGGINVPCIVYFPKKSGFKGKVFQASMQAIDWAPTIMDVAGVAPKGKKFDGVSYLAAFEGKTAAPAPIRTWCYNKVYLTDISNAALIDGNWKLHRPRITELNRRDNKGKVPQNITPQKWQLFDLSKDPFEKVDLATKQPGQLKKMTSLFDAWWKEVLSENVAISGPVK